MFDSEFWSAFFTAMKWLVPILVLGVAWIIFSARRERARVAALRAKPANGAKRTNGDVVAKLDEPTPPKKVGWIFTAILSFDGTLRKYKISGWEYKLAQKMVLTEETIGIKYSWIANWIVDPEDRRSGQRTHRREDITTVDIKQRGFSWVFDIPNWIGIVEISIRDQTKPIIWLTRNPKGVAALIQPEKHQAKNQLVSQQVVGRQIIAGGDTGDDILESPEVLAALGRRYLREQGGRPPQNNRGPRRQRSDDGRRRS